MKVGFYLKNIGVSDVDLSNPESGNPGIGGTQFNFVTLPYYLIKYWPDEVTPIIYANDNDPLPTSITSYSSDNIFDAYGQSTGNNCDLFVYRPIPDTFQSGFVKSVCHGDTKLIAWAHNVPLSLEHMNVLSESDIVSRFVVVGRERLDQIRDHGLFSKSRCIHNGFDPTAYTPNPLVEYDSPVVAYVGSLVPQKGFHILAQVWERIENRFDNARLVVIGSGRLYDRSAELGKWGVAAEDYEKRFRSYLSDNCGGVRPSVSFKGTMGTEKIPILQQASVGIVNPTGNTENCPGSAIEFQAAGTPVVSVARWGLLDTVVNGKTGILVDSPTDIDQAIIELIKNDSKRREYARNGIEFIKSKFSQKDITKKWVDLFVRVKGGRSTVTEPIKDNLLYRFKWARETLRILKKWVPPIRGLPPLCHLSGSVKRWFRW